MGNKKNVMNAALVAQSKKKNTNPFAAGGSRNASKNFNSAHGFQTQKNTHVKHG